MLRALQAATAGFKDIKLATATDKQLAQELLRRVMAARNNLDSTVDKIKNITTTIPKVGGDLNREWSASSPHKFYNVLGPKYDNRHHNNSKQ